MGITSTRVAVSLSVATAVVATVAGTAGARIPEGDAGAVATPARPAVVALPDVVERAVQVRTQALALRSTGTDAVARAIARRNR